MTIRIRRNVARGLGLGLIAIALLLLSSSGTAGADGSGTKLTAKGWWWEPNSTKLPTDAPAPPNVGADQLWVQGSPAGGGPQGQTAFAAIRYSVDKSQVAKTLTIKVGANGDGGGSSAILLACQTGSSWVPAQEGKWETAPNVSNSCVNGTRSADGLSWAFAVGTLQTGDVLDISLVPGPDPNTQAPSAFSLVFDAPTDASLATATGSAPPPTTPAPTNFGTSPGGVANPATGGAGAGSFHPAAPVTAIAPAIPSDKVGQTATAPAKQQASQGALDAQLASTAPAKDRNKTPGYIVLAIAAAIGLYAWRQDNLMAMNGGTLPGAPEESGGLGRFARPRQGRPPALTSSPGTDRVRSPPNLGSVDALAGPVIVVAALLAFAGGLKIVRPAPTSGALRAMGLPSAPPLARALGLGEVLIGVSAAVTFARPLLALLASAYLAFAAFVAAALGRNTPLQSCGCFGQTDTPPSAVHLGLNIAAAVTAFAAALSGTPSLGTTMGDQPWHAVPFVLLVAICVYLCVLIATVLPQTFGSRASARTAH